MELKTTRRCVRPPASNENPGLYFYSMLDGMQVHYGVTPTFLGGDLERHCETKRAVSPGKSWTQIARGERTMERAIQELISKYHTLLPSIFMTGVHAPSPHPKSPMWHRTVTGFELKWSKTSRLAFSLLNIKNLLEPEMVRTVVAMNCFHFFLT